jgi:hypothetical protein
VSAKFVFDLRVPMGFHIPSLDVASLEPSKPLCLATVMARISYTTTGRLRVSIGDTMVLDRLDSEPSTELLALAKVDALFERAGIKQALLTQGLQIQAKKKNGDDSCQTP